MNWVLWIVSYFAGTASIQVRAQQNLTVSNASPSGDYDEDYPDERDRDYPDLDYYNDDRREGRSIGSGSEDPHHRDFDDFMMKQLRSTVPGVPGVDYALYQSVPDTSFDCGKQDSPGFYGDVEAQCQVFHICQENDRHDSFLCPIGTVFNQISFVCDWWFNFKCEETPVHYYLNSKFHSGPAMASMEDTMKKMQDVHEKKIMKMARGRRAGNGVVLIAKKRDSLESSKPPVPRKRTNLFVLRMRKKISFLRSTEHPVDVEPNSLPVDRFDSLNHLRSSEESVLTSTLPFEGSSADDSAVKVTDSREIVKITEYLTTAGPGGLNLSDGSHSRLSNLSNNVKDVGNAKRMPLESVFNSSNHNEVTGMNGDIIDPNDLTNGQFIKFTIKYANTTFDEMIRDTDKENITNNVVAGESANPNSGGEKYERYSDKDTSNGNITASLLPYSENMTFPSAALPVVTQSSDNVDATSVTSSGTLNLSQPFGHQNNFIIGNDTHISVSVTIHSSSGRSRLQWKRLPGAKRIRRIRLKNSGDDSSHHANSINDDTVFKRRMFAQKPRSRVMWIPAKKNSLENRLDFGTFMQPQSYDAIAEVKLLPIDHSLQKSVLETDELLPISVTEISHATENMRTKSFQSTVYPLDIQQRNNESSQYLLDINQYGDQNSTSPETDRSNNQSSKYSENNNRFSGHSSKSMVNSNRFDDLENKSPVNISPFDDHSSKTPLNVNRLDDQSTPSIKNLEIVESTSNILDGITDLSKFNKSEANAKINDKANIMLVVKPAIQRTIVKRQQNRSGFCKDSICIKLLQDGRGERTRYEQNETSNLNDLGSSTLFENLESVRPKLELDRQSIIGVSPSEQFSVKYDPGPNCNENNFRSKALVKGWSVIIDAGLITKEKTVKRRGCSKPNNKREWPMKKFRPAHSPGGSNIQSKNYHNQQGAKLNGESMDQRYWLNLVKNWLEKSPAKFSEKQEPTRNLRQHSKRAFPAGDNTNPFHIPKWDDAESRMIKNNFKRASLNSRDASKTIDTPKYDWSSDLQTERSDWSQATQKANDWPSMKRPRMYTFRNGAVKWGLEDINSEYTNQGTRRDQTYAPSDRDIFTSGTNANRNSGIGRPSGQTDEFIEEDDLWSHDIRDYSRSWSGSYVGDDSDSLSNMQDWTSNVRVDYDENSPKQRNRNADSLGWSHDKGSGTKQSNRGRSMTDEWNWSSDEGFDGKTNPQGKNPDASAVKRDPRKGNSDRGGRSNPNLNAGRNWNSMKPQAVDKSLDRNFPIKGNHRMSMKPRVSVSSKGGSRRDFKSEDNSKWSGDADPEWQTKRATDDDWTNEDIKKVNLPQSKEWTSDEKSDWADEQTSSKGSTSDDKSDWSDEQTSSKGWTSDEKSDWVDEKPSSKGWTSDEKSDWANKESNSKAWATGKSKDRNLWPPTMSSINPPSNKGSSKKGQSQTAQRTPDWRNDARNRWPESAGDSMISGYPATNRGSNKGDRDIDFKRTNPSPPSRRSQGSGAENKWRSKGNKGMNDPVRNSRRQKGSSDSFKGRDKDWNSHPDRQRSSFGSSGQDESNLSSWDSTEDYDDRSSDRNWSWPPKSGTPQAGTQSSKGSNKGQGSSVPSKGSSRRPSDGTSAFPNKGSQSRSKGSGERPQMRARGNSWGSTKGENVDQRKPKAAPMKGSRGMSKMTWKKTNGAPRNTSNKGNSEMKKIVWSARISTDGKPGNGWVPITLRPSLKRNVSLDASNNKGSDISWSTTSDESPSGEEDWPSSDASGADEDWPSEPKSAPDDWPAANVGDSSAEDWLSSNEDNPSTDEDWPSTNAGSFIAGDWPSINSGSLVAGDWPTTNLESSTKSSGFVTPNIGSSLLINDWSLNNSGAITSNKNSHSEHKNLEQNPKLAPFTENAQNGADRPVPKKDGSQTPEESAKHNFYVPGFIRRYKRGYENSDRPFVDATESKSLKIIKSGKIITHAYNNDSNKFFLTNADLLVGEDIQPENGSLIPVRSKRLSKRVRSDSLLQNFTETDKSGAKGAGKEIISAKKDLKYLEPLPKESIVRQTWSSPFYSTNFSASGWIPVNAHRWPDSRKENKLHSSSLRESVLFGTVQDSDPWSSNLSTNNTVYSKGGLQESVRKDTDEVNNKPSTKLVSNESVSPSSANSTEVKVGNETLRILAFSDIMKKLSNKDSGNTDPAEIHWSIPLNTAPKMYSLKPVDQSNTTGRNISNSWIFSSGNGTKQAWILSENGHLSIYPSAANSSQLSGGLFDNVESGTGENDTRIEDFSASELRSNPEDRVGDASEESGPKFDGFDRGSDWKPVITAIGRVIPFNKTYNNPQRI